MFLAEVVNGRAGGRTRARLRRENLRGAHRLVGLRHEFRRKNRRARRAPTPTSTRRKPACSSPVARAAHRKFRRPANRRETRAGRGFPLLIRSEPLHRAIGVGNLDFRNEGERVAIDARPIQPDLAAIPTVAQFRAEDVRAFADEPRRVVSLALDARVVIRPPRRKKGVTDLSSVQRELVNASADA